MLIKLKHDDMRFSEVYCSCIHDLLTLYCWKKFSFINFTLTTCHSIISHYSYFGSQFNTINNCLLHTPPPADYRQTPLKQVVVDVLCPFVNIVCQRGGAPVTVLCNLQRNMSDGKYSLKLILTGKAVLQINYSEIVYI